MNPATNEQLIPSEEPGSVMLITTAYASVEVIGEIEDHREIQEIAAVFETQPLEEPPAAPADYFAAQFPNLGYDPLDSTSQQPSAGEPVDTTISQAVTARPPVASLEAHNAAIGFELAA